MTLRQSRSILLLACTMLAPVALRAQDMTAPPAPVTLAGSIDAFSQYRFRGISRSDGQPAAQGDIAITHTSGVYGGITVTSTSPGASVNFGKAEADLYAGYDHALGASGVTLDLGVRGYLYADRSGADMVELSLALDRQIGPIDLRAGLAYAPPQHNAGGSARDNAYEFAEARGDIPGTPLHLHAHVGHTAGSLDVARAYWDYRVGVGATHHAFGLDVSLVGTSLSHFDAQTTRDPSATWRAVRSAGVATVSFQF